MISLDWIHLNLLVTWASGLLQLKSQNTQHLWGGGVAQIIQALVASFTTALQYTISLSHVGPIINVKTSIDQSSTDIALNRLNSSKGKTMMSVSQIASCDSFTNVTNRVPDKQKGLYIWAVVCVWSTCVNLINILVLHCKAIIVFNSNLLLFTCINNRCYDCLTSNLENATFTSFWCTSSSILKPEKLMVGMSNLST